jgi:hypothetical protein
LGYFHHLVVPAGLACFWIPAFAGMTMKTKAAGIGASKKFTEHPQNLHIAYALARFKKRCHAVPSLEPAKRGWTVWPD